MHLVTWDVNAITGSNSTIQSNYSTSRIPRYCCPNHRRYASMFHSWNQAFRITDLRGRSARCGGNNMKDDSSDHITHFQLSDVQVLWSLYYLLRFLALFSVARGLTIAALPWMLDLWSSRRTVCEETESSRWILSFAVTFAAAVLWFLDIILFNVRRFLSFSFGFRPLFVSADDGFPWSVYVVMTLGTAALDTPNEVAVWLQILH